MAPGFHKRFWIFFCLFANLLLFGCINTGATTHDNPNIQGEDSNISNLIIQSVQSENMTVNHGSYNFTYNGKHWRPFSSNEEFEYSIFTSKGQFDNAFMAFDEETILLVLSEEEQRNCSYLTAEYMEYKELETTTETINDREWSIGSGYADVPNEYTIYAHVQCPDIYISYSGCMGIQKLKKPLITPNCIRL